MAPQPDTRHFLFIRDGSLIVSGLTVQQDPHPMFGINARAFRCDVNGSLTLIDVRATTPYVGASASDCTVHITSSSFSTTDTMRIPWMVDIDGGELVLDRSTVELGGIRTDNTDLQITNNLIRYTGVSIGSGTGTLEFNTITDTSLPSGNARAVECGTSAPDRPELIGNVVWDVTGPATTVVSVCRSSNNLIGPIDYPGTGNFNADPLFVSSGNHHLGPSSPAIDKLATGPELDLDGDARPHGTSWDLGCDEVIP
jgi:hypothetical protein